MDDFKVLIVVNPVSGNSTGAELAQFVQDKLSGKSITHALFETTGNNDASRLTTEIDTYRPDRVLVVGGDGTINLVAQVIKNTHTIMGIIPAGSANGLATNFDIPTSRSEQIETALASKTVEMDIMNINGKSSIHISDLGLHARLIKNYDQQKISGKLGYFLAAIPTLLRHMKRRTFEVTCNNKSFKIKAVVVIIANARKFGTGAIVNPKSSIDDGKFELIIFKRFNIKEILRTFFNNTRYDSQAVSYSQTNHAIIKCEKDEPFQIDGEFIGKIRSLEVSISDEKVIVAVP